MRLRKANSLTGVYSIAKFELIEQGTGTRIVFDQNGFPKGDGEHLASGWKAHYWGPPRGIPGIGPAGSDLREASDPWFLQLFSFV
jgi:hypothetical protein